MKQRVRITDEVRVEKFSACQRCGGRVVQRENGHVCLNCGALHFRDRRGKMEYTGNVQ